MPFRTRASSCAAALARREPRRRRACGSSQPTAVDRADQPSPAGPARPSRPPASRPRARPTAPRRRADADPGPTPVLVPAPLTGLMVSPAAARRHPIAVMIDDLSPARPQSGFSAASIVWQAPAEGGIPRYMMVFGENQPTAVGPVRSSRYYYIAWAAEWKAVYAHAGGSPQAMSTLRAKGNGQLVYNADEFAMRGSFNRVASRVPAAQPVHRRQAARSRSPGGSAPSPATYKPIWTFAPDAPARAAPGRRQDHRSATRPARSATTTTGRRTPTCGRSASRASRRTPRPRSGSRPKNVVVMLMRFGPLNDGHPNKHRLEAKVRRQRDRLDLDEREDDQGHLAKKSLTAPTKFYDATGRRSP